MRLNIYTLLFFSLFTGAASGTVHNKCRVDVQNCACPSPPSTQLSENNDDNTDKKAIRLKDGSYYIGEVKGKLPHGKGKLVFANSDIFEGTFVDGRIEGEGKFRSGGNVYEGIFSDERPSAQGLAKIIVEADSKYKLVADGEAPSQPTKKDNIVRSIRLKDGSTYIGELKGKRPHGEGKITFPNGDTYEGEFPGK